MIHAIDRYAYSNAIRQVDPAQKGGLALLALGLCLTLDRPLVSLFTIGWMLGLSRFWAQVPIGMAGRMLFVQGFFLAISVVGVAVSVTFGLDTATGWGWQLGPLRFTSSPSALVLALGLLGRTLGCVAALNFLILTTPLVDVIEVLRRLRLPEVLIDVMTVTYRTIFVLLESVQRIIVAQAARLGYSNPRRALASTAQLASQILLDTYRRSHQMQQSLESRGMAGPLRVLPMTYTRSLQAWWLGGAMGVTLLIVGLS